MSNPSSMTTCCGLNSDVGALFLESLTRMVELIRGAIARGHSHMVLVAFRRSEPRGETCEIVPGLRARFVGSEPHPAGVRIITDVLVDDAVRWCERFAEKHDLLLPQPWPPGLVATPAGTRPDREEG